MMDENQMKAKAKEIADSLHEVDDAEIAYAVVLYIRKFLEKTSDTEKAIRELSDRISENISEFQTPERVQQISKAFTDMAEKYPQGGERFLEQLEGLSDLRLNRHFPKAFYPILSAIGKASPDFAQKAIHVMDKTYQPRSMSEDTLTRARAGIHDIVLSQPTAGKEALDAIVSMALASVAKKNMWMEDEYVYAIGDKDGIAEIAKASFLSLGSKIQGQAFDSVRRIVQITKNIKDYPYLPKIEKLATSSLTDIVKLSNSSENRIYGEMLELVDKKPHLQNMLIEYGDALIGYSDSSNPRAESVPQLLSNLMRAGHQLQGKEATAKIATEVFDCVEEYNDKTLSDRLEFAEKGYRKEDLVDTDDLKGYFNVLTECVEANPQLSKKALGFARAYSQPGIEPYVFQPLLSAIVKNDRSTAREVMELAGENAEFGPTESNQNCLGKNTLATADILSDVAKADPKLEKEALDVLNDKYLQYLQGAGNYIEDCRGLWQGKDLLLVATVADNMADKMYDSFVDGTPIEYVREEFSQKLNYLKKLSPSERKQYIQNTDLNKQLLTCAILEERGKPFSKKEYEEAYEKMSRKGMFDMMMSEEAKALSLSGNEQKALHTRIKKLKEVSATDGGKYIDAKVALSHRKEKYREDVMLQQKLKTYRAQREGK